MSFKNHNTTPETIKKLRESLNMTQQKAAESVHTSLRVWQRYEAPVTAKTSARIPTATLDLFCTKHGLPYPPNEMGKLSKTITFFGGLGGMGHTQLTIDISALLQQDGYDVLIISGKHGPMYYSERAARLNIDFPKVIIIDENKTVPGDFQKELPQIINNYDFVFIDSHYAHRNNIEKIVQPDILITPVLMNHDRFRVKSAQMNCRALHKKLINQKTLVACLLVGVNTDYTFDPGYYGFDYEVEKDALKDFYQSMVNDMKTEQAQFEEFNNLRKSGVYVMEAFTTKSYNQYYDGYYNSKVKSFSITNQHPNSLATHELKAVKNEILRMLKIPTK